MKTFKNCLQDERFVMTAELSLGDGNGPEEVLKQAEILQHSFSAVQVAEDPFQAGQVSGLAAATILIRNGIDAITELNGRDRNRIALMSDLLGLRALGIGSIVVTDGPEGQERLDEPHRPVGEVNCRELISIAQSMNEDDSIRPGEEFLIGTQTGIPPAQIDTILAELAARASAGAHVLQLQPCFDMDVLRAFMQRLVETQLTWNYAVMVCLAPLPSIEAARRLIRQRPGCVIPSLVLSRLESSSDPGSEGIAICSELIREVKTIPGVAGVQLITMGSALDVVETIRRSTS